MYKRQGIVGENLIDSETCRTDKIVHVDECVTASVLTLPGRDMSQSDLTTTIDPDVLKCIDILPCQGEIHNSKAASRRLVEEQKQDETLNQWWKMAEEDRNGFFCPRRYIVS